MIGKRLPGRVLVWIRRSRKQKAKVNTCKIHLPVRQADTVNYEMQMQYRIKVIRKHFNININFFAYIGVSSYPKMDGLCPSCGMIHTQESECAIEQGSPVFRRRRSVPSPCETPTTSTMRFPCDDSNSGPTPNKQKRLSGMLNITDMQIKDEELDADNINSDIDETEEVDTVGASQYPDDEVFDPEGGGLLFGFAYFPCEVTLPNTTAVRPGLEEVELTPGRQSIVQNIARIANAVHCHS